MDEHLKEALEIVRAQASVRTMTEEEITSMVHNLSKGIKTIMDGVQLTTEPEPPCDPKKAIREASIVCLECGKTFKTITKRHLAHHGLSPEEYRKKWGYPKKTALVCKGLQRARRKKMKDMKLWERRGKTEEGK